MPKRPAFPRVNPKAQALAQKLVLNEVLPRLFASSSDPDALTADIIEKLENKLSTAVDSGDRQTEIWSGVIRNLVYEMLGDAKRNDKRKRKAVSARQL